MNKKTFKLLGLILITIMCFSFNSSTNDYKENSHFSTVIDYQDSRLKKSMEAGKRVYERACTVCHQSEGQGIRSVFPPIAKSDYLMKDLNRSIRELITGSSGEITVNGIKYNGVMPATGLNDKDIADVLNYIRNSWGNKGKMVTPAMVYTVRKGK